MLFGVKLVNEMYPPWKDSYINYDHLKDLLKEKEVTNATAADTWSERDESKFVEALDKELENVYSFQIQKFNNLLDKLINLEKQTSSEEKIKSIDPENFQRILEDSLTEAQELDNFSRLNFTGFIKIVKKHDKLHPKYPSVKSLLEVRLKELPFHSEEYSPLLYRISYLYNILRGNFSTVSQSLASTSKLSNVASVEPSNTEYKIYKFWIHKDNLMEVKTRILRHLPVLVYAQTPTENDDLIDKFESEILDTDGGIQSSNSSPVTSDRKLGHNSLDPMITTLYFDNEFFELYNNKLLKSSNAPTLRLRWTGKLVDKPDLFLEKKMVADGNNNNDDDQPAHFEELRLKMKQKYLNGFVFDGEKKYEESVLRRMKESGSPNSTIVKTQSDFETMQKFIMEEQLQPVMRTMYTRTAFQIPGDDRIRVTIDSDILYIREDSFDKSRPVRDPKSWHRTDIDADVSNPMRFLRSGEYAKFPFSVMEIKIKEINSERNSFAGKSIMSMEKLPRKHGQWLTELTNSHLVKEIPKFSTFIQGIATLFGEDDKLDILPFWLPELENDIRRNPKQAYEEEELKLKKQKEIQKRLDGMRRLSKIQKQPPSLNEFDSELVQRENNIINPNGTTDTVNPISYEADLEDYESSEDEDEGQSGRRTQLKKGVRRIPKKNQTTEAIFLNILAGRESKLTGFDSEEEEIILPAGVRKPTSYIKNAGPVKVEAKVWLANERTFNRWLKVTTLLSVLTFSIYNSVRKAAFPKLANTLAYIYFGLTIFCGLWSYKTYMDRLKVIKERSGKHLDAPLGPIIVAVVLAFTLIVNFLVAFRDAATRKNQAFATSTVNGQSEELSKPLQSIQNFIFQLVGAEQN